jgi:restriction system protein
MALWKVKAGKHGEYEARFFEDARIYLTWEDFADVDLTAHKDREAVRNLLRQTYPDAAIGRVNNWVAQIYAFLSSIQKDDYVVVPRSNRTVAIGIVQSDYQYDAKEKDASYKHYRTIKWINEGLPRTRFDQDLLYSFGAFNTICQIKRNNAELRIKDLLSKGKTTTSSHEIIEAVDQDASTIEIEDLAQDQLANYIIRKFKGHGLERLVESILKAQGYVTYHSPKGADGGKDVLACSGNLGFGEQRICVQVKSGDSPVDLPTLNQLIGTMQTVNATHGLMVAWGGFKQSLEGERGRQFFRVRLWDQNDLIEQIQL